MCTEEFETPQQNTPRTWTKMSLTFRKQNRGSRWGVLSVSHFCHILKESENSKLSFTKSRLVPCHYEWIPSSVNKRESSSHIAGAKVVQFHPNSSPLLLERRGYVLCWAFQLDYICVAEKNGIQDNCQKAASLPDRNNSSLGHVVFGCIVDTLC